VPIGWQLPARWHHIIDTATSIRRSQFLLILYVR